MELLKALAEGGHSPLSAAARLSVIWGVDVSEGAIRRIADRHGLQFAPGRVEPPAPFDVLLEPPGDLPFSLRSPNPVVARELAQVEFTEAREALRRPVIIVVVDAAVGPVYTVSAAEGLVSEGVTREWAAYVDTEISGGRLRHGNRARALEAGPPPWFSDRWIVTLILDVVEVSGGESSPPVYLDDEEPTDEEAEDLDE